MSEFFSDYTFRIVALGSGMLGLIAGTLGTYAVLRRQSLIGDAVSHAALPGIVLAFMLTESKMPPVLLMGAGISGWLALVWVYGMTGTTRLKFDASLGASLAAFFGVGMVLLTYIRNRAGAAQAGLDRYLFGQAATLLMEDIRVMGVLGLVALLLVLVFWKEFQLLTFDVPFAAALGYPVRLLEGLMTGLLVVAIVVGLQTVGVVLMSAVLIAPAVAARQWTRRLGSMMLLAGILGLVGGVAGAGVSSMAPHVPTGPVIVLIMTTMTLVSLVIAYDRGLLWRFIRRWRHQSRRGAQRVLAVLQELAAHHTDAGHCHATAVIQAAVGKWVPAERILRRLERRGLVKQPTPGCWLLTEKGVQQANRYEDARS